MEKLTPMLRQYMAIKKEHSEAILLFRLGDFYEMFFDDAKLASRLLDITLTSREAGKRGRIPMAGVPYHAVEGYIARLLRAGHKVALCDQVEDPKQAKGIVKRAVTRVTTPGTVLSEALLEQKSNNYLIALKEEKNRFGLAYVDLSTGEFKIAELPGREPLSHELTRLNPSECLLPRRLENNDPLHRWLKQFIITLSFGEDWTFIYETACQTLCSHFNTHSLEGFGCEKMPVGICAAGAILDYLKDTQKSTLPHLTTLSVHTSSEYMVLDAATQRNLELITALGTSSKQGSLLGILDETVTAMGGRVMRNWLLRPLLPIEKIRERQEAIQELIDRSATAIELRQTLRGISDIERLLSRVCCGTANARDLVSLKNSLEVIPAVKEKLAVIEVASLSKLNDEIDNLDDVYGLIGRALVDDPPFSLREGGLVRDGFDQELDNLRKISRGGKEWIASLQKKEVKRTGIGSLKIGFNKVFGYYIEVTNANLKNVPDDYIRKQTLANAERFITPELKEWELRVLGAEERIGELEYEIFCKLRDQVAEQAKRIQTAASVLAQLDVLTALAKVAKKYNYSRPKVDEENRILIREGRHPVVEQMLSPDPFIPNDCQIDREANQVLIITGPNMAGKSTYIRQVALIVLMAQMGSFVPAKQAEIGVVDRIFTRVGASDELVKGRSTFMVEMQEAANILNNATVRSLIILDEIGRGTSTFDGMSIAWAVAEYLHETEKVQARTLFATHYHELTELADDLQRIKNYTIAVREWNEQIVFLRKVIPGGSDRSYGIHVARLAGLPPKVITRAREILEHLEADSLRRDEELKLSGSKKSGRADQLKLFTVKEEHPVVTNLRNLDINGMTPLAALNYLGELQRKVRESGGK